MISFLWKGCSAIFLKLSNLNILIDPGDLFSVGDLEGLLENGEGIDIVMYTHEHTGHFDPSLLRRIVNEYDPYIVANKGVFRFVRRWFDRNRIMKLKGGEVVSLLDGKIYALRAVHPGIHPIVFLIEFHGKAIFHGDSTGFSHEFEAFSPVDLAFIPAGNPSPNASPNEAIRIIKALIPKVAIPIHGTDEELEEVGRKVAMAGLNVRVIRPKKDKLIEIEI